MFQVRVLARQPDAWQLVNTLPVDAPVMDVGSAHHLMPTTPDTSTSFDRPLVLVVLAAGMGTRMRSSLPKPFHPVAGRPMIDRVLLAGAAAGPDVIAVVVSEATRDIRDHVDPPIDLALVEQPEMRGTGDAVHRVFEVDGLVPDDATVIVVFCDHPLLDSDTVRHVAEQARRTRHLVTVVSCVLPSGGPYGRIERDDAGRPVGVIERADDDLRLRAGETEINTGMMALDARWARSALTRLTPSPATGELYLTELIGMAVREHEDGSEWPVGVVQADPALSLGVNDRVQLAAAEVALRQRIREQWMLAGVTMPDPAMVYIDDDVAIGPDTVIHPFSFIRSGTTIGASCMIGPHADLARSTIGNGVVIRASTVEGATIHDGADVGPYSHIRPGTVIGARSHVGNFGELKNARLGEDVKVGHFGYLGDVTIGDRTNIGAGTVTANFDGEHKHSTSIGPDAFIASDTILRAPVTVGEGGRTGAGAVVTRDVQPGETVVGVPARPFAPSRSGTGHTTGSQSSRGQSETEG